MDKEIQGVRRILFFGKKQAHGGVRWLTNFTFLLGILLTILFGVENPRNETSLPSPSVKEDTKKLARATCEFRGAFLAPNHYSTPLNFKYCLFNSLKNGSEYRVTFQGVAFCPDLSDSSLMRFEGLISLICNSNEVCDTITAKIKSKLSIASPEDGNRASCSKKFEEKEAVCVVS